jgi:predicted Zn-dependent protease
LNHDDAVSWYRLARAEKALGNTAEADKADAEFQRLRGKSSEHIAAPAIFNPDQDTKQEVDPNATAPQ